MEHVCHFCGTPTNDDGYEYNGKRHYLSDCRPDLVAHEIGSRCTWDSAAQKPINERCYAYQDRYTLQWTFEHRHFYDDGPL